MTHSAQKYYVLRKRYSRDDCNAIKAGDWRGQMRRPSQLARYPTVA
jgi:hypothetical protein